MCTDPGIWRPFCFYVIFSASPASIVLTQVLCLDRWARAFVRSSRRRERGRRPTFGLVVLSGSSIPLLWLLVTRKSPESLVHWLYSLSQTSEAPLSSSSFAEFIRLSILFLSLVVCLAQTLRASLLFIHVHAHCFGFAIWKFGKIVLSMQNFRCKCEKITGLKFYPCRLFFVWFFISFRGNYLFIK